MQENMKYTTLRVWNSNLDAVEQSFVLPSRSRFVKLYNNYNDENYCIIVTMENGYIGYIPWPTPTNGKKLDIKLFRFHHTPITVLKYYIYSLFKNHMIHNIFFLVDKMEH